MSKKKILEMIMENPTIITDALVPQINAAFRESNKEKGKILNDLYLQILPYIRKRNER